ncbi:type IV toxin-antitoxin system AbiEi family antitoxin [Pseudarthrobacter sp. J1738]|uniref:type IV toxin-antitoxin system AbiEi family antitoxin n=1 Tax=Pseudarthrobacter sp. J1738 TaxID=3420446 RepID=UPI003D2753A1
MNSASATSAADPPPPAFVPNPDAVLMPGTPFTSAELQSMANDGVLQALYGMSYVSAALPKAARLRARSASLQVPERVRQKVVAGRMTAAWIHGCADVPERLTLLVDANRRLSSLRPHIRCNLHEVHLGQMDVQSLGGLMVTSPLRTAVDLAMHVRAEDSLPALRLFLDNPEFGLSQRLLVSAVSATPRVPNKLKALQALWYLENETEPFTAKKLHHCQSV